MKINFMKSFGVLSALCALNIMAAAPAAGFECEKMPSPSLQAGYQNKAPAAASLLMENAVLPEIKSISPNPVVPGAPLTITGVNFGERKNMTDTVKFNGINVMESSWSNEKIVVYAPRDVYPGKLQIKTTRGMGPEFSFEITAAAVVAPAARAAESSSAPAAAAAATTKAASSGAFSTSPDTLYRSFSGKPTVPLYYNSQRDINKPMYSLYNGNSGVSLYYNEKHPGYRQNQVTEKSVSTEVFSNHDSWGYVWGNKYSINTRITPSLESQKTLTSDLTGNYNLQYTSYYSWFYGGRHTAR